MGRLGPMNSRSFGGLARRRPLRESHGLGPHPEEYHQEIYSRLNNGISTCQTRTECKRKLVEALDEIAGDTCKPGSRLNKLLTKQPGILNPGTSA